MQKLASNAPELMQPTYLNPAEEQGEQSTTDQDDVAQMVARAYQHGKRNQEGYETLWVELWNLWRFYKHADSAVKIFDPVGYALVAGLLSKLFVRTPRVALTARSGGWKWLAKIVQAHLEYQLANPDSDEPVEEEYLSFVTELAVLGTAVGKTSWCTKYVTQYEDQTIQDPMTGEYSIERVPTRKKAFDDPKFEHIPLENFFIQPGATSISEAKWVIFEKFVDTSYLEYLKELVDEGTGEPICNVPALEEAIASGGSNQPDMNRGNVSQSRKATEASNQSEEQKDRFHLMEYWEDDRYILLLNNQWVIRDEDNPNDDGKKPFIAMPYTKVPHQFYGIGAMEPTADLQKVQNITLTQRIEYVSNLLNQQFSVLTAREVDEDALMDGYPVVHTTSHDAIQPLNKGNVPQASFLTANEINAGIERGMGISGYQVGAPAAASDATQGTKGGIQTIVQESQSRFDQLLRRIENVLVRGIVERFIDLNAQYFPSFESKLILVTDGQQQIPVPLNKELLLATKYHVSIVPGSIGAVDQQRKTQTFLQWAQFGMSTLPNFNREAAVMEAAELQDIERPDRFITPMGPMVPGMTPAPMGGPGMSMMQGGMDPVSQPEQKALV